MLTNELNYDMMLYVSKTCASGSAVEHLLAKEGVAGSIPVSRFFFYFLLSVFILVISWLVSGFSFYFLNDS